MKFRSLVMLLVFAHTLLLVHAQDTLTETVLELNQVLSGHSYIVKSVAFSHDSTLIASGSDGEVFLWETSSGERVASWFEPEDDVIRLLFHPTFSLLFAASEDGNVYVYDLEQMELLQTLSEMGNNMRDIALNQNGTLLFGAGDGNIIPVWSVTETRIALRAALDPTTLNDWSITIDRAGVLYFADDRTLHSFDFVDGYLSLWEDSSGTWIVDIRVLADRTVIFGRDGGKELYVLRDNELSELPTIALLAVDVSDNDTVVITDASRVKLVDIQSLVVIADFRASDSLWSVAISSDGKQIAAGSSGHDVYLLNLK